MKNIKLNFKFKANKIKKIQRWAYLGVILLTLIFLTQLGLFLYTNVFLALKQIDKITIIQSKVADQTIDMKTFKKVIKTLNNKKQGCILDKINDPFYPQNKPIVINSIKKATSSQEKDNNVIKQSEKKESATTSLSNQINGSKNIPPQSLDNIRPKH